MIDTHCHLYSEEFKEDIDAVIQRAADSGITRFYMPSVDSHNTEAMLKIEAKYPETCFSMIGLHPCSVKENYQQELDHVASWLGKRKFAAIGEIGLDFYWDKTFTEQQYICFRKQIEMALEFNLPVILHSRNATIETINVINEYRSASLKGIFHCFGGSLSEAIQIVNAGFMLGIGGVVTYKNSGLAEVLSEIDLKNIVLETDCPYLAPVPFRGKRNESSYLRLIAEKVADVKHTTLQKVIEITSSNANNIFAY